MSAGCSDHVVTNVSPPTSSITNISAFTAMMDAVFTGKRVGRREASPSGITPISTSRWCDVKMRHSSLQAWASPAQPRRTAPATVYALFWRRSHGLRGLLDQRNNRNGPRPVDLVTGRRLDHR